jgi:hypothetical protein
LTIARSLPFAAALLFVASPALAYRPFDGTDADVADVGEFELELGPAHYYATRGSRYLIAPATVLNLGLVRGLELVIDFKNFVGLDDVPDQARVRLLDTDVFLKWVIRRGVLQRERGLSVAIEAGPLTPEIQGQDRFGAQADVIISHQWKTGTIHFNEQAAYNRAGNLDLFSSIILEGPHEMTVRPVSEIFFENEFGEGIGGKKYSALVGAIWAAHESIDFDFGMRLASENDVGVAEIRLGFTWVVDVWEPGATKKSALHGPRRRWAMR